jgi:uncharacterized repeat protein (TIGR03803 family)
MRHTKSSRIIIAILALATATLLLASTASAQFTYKTLYAFTGGADGNEYPGYSWFSSGLVFDTAGNLYGTTAAGGAYGYGVVFKLTPNSDGSWTESVLYSFTGGADGADPFAGLIFDSAGNLYGTTVSGGLASCSQWFTQGCGLVFELTPNLDGTWNEEVLYSFTGGKDGANPMAVLALDSAGNLYGTADRGGKSKCDQYGQSGCGALFELSPNSDGTWTESTLYDFTGGVDGSPQFGPVVLDSAGNLYTTAQNGKYDWGVILELPRNPGGGWGKGRILHTLRGLADGGDAFSFTGLVFDSAGNLYGTTFWGPFPEAGTVFRLIPTTKGPWKWELVHNFGTSNSYHPVAGVIFDSAGNLYGTTVVGGTSNLGEVFMISPDMNGGAKFTVLYDFSNQPLNEPFSLILDAAGNLYGTTFSSNIGAGGVFELARQ